jgi:hypothetical protein
MEVGRLRNIYTRGTTLRTWLATMNDKSTVDMSCQAGRYVVMGNRFNAVEPIKGRQSKGGKTGGVHDALEGQSSRVAQALNDGAIRPLAAVHLKLIDLADRLPVGDRHRLRPLTSILVLFEDELRRLAGL